VSRPAPCGAGADSGEDGFLLDKVGEVPVQLWSDREAAAMLVKATTAARRVLVSMTKLCCLALEWESGAMSE